LTTRLLALTLLLFTTTAADWRDYRGPRANGHSPAVGLPLKWSETEHVKWKTPIHGKGWSSPIIQGSQIWFTTATPDGREMFVLCVDKETGRILLDRKLYTNEEVDPINDVNSYASPSPAIDGERVYLHFGTYGTICLNTKTFEKVWERKDLHCRHSVGPGSSPILFKNLLILTFDGIDQQFMIALDAKTGQTVWKKPRSIMAEFEAAGKMPEPERRKAFSTPVIVETPRGPEMICNAAAAVCAYNPATGDELWRVKIGQGYSNGSRPIVDGDLAFINTGYDRSEVWAVEMGGKGDVTTSNVRWKCARNMPYKTSPLVVEGLFYSMNDSGILTCLDAKTGEEVWKERIGGSFSASPLYADGRIYLFDEAGKCTVIKPGRKLDILAENTLPTGCMASPAVDGKSLIVRTKTHLYRLEGGAPSAPR
jgi:outer membrane protein assembly factor BamB